MPTKTEQYNLRIPKAVSDSLEKIAKENKMRKNDLVRIVLSLLASRQIKLGVIFNSEKQGI